MQIWNVVRGQISGQITKNGLKLSGNNPAHEERKHKTAQAENVFKFIQRSSAVQ